MKNQKVRFEGTVKTGNKTVSVKAFVIEFEDNNSFISYCPALNVYGYGKTEEEARDSFEFGLEEFIDYAMKKNTFVHELELLGWKIKKEKKFTAPGFAELLSNNKELKRITDSRPFKKVDKVLDFPMAFA